MNRPVEEGRCKYYIAIIHSISAPYEACMCYQDAVVMQRYLEKNHMSLFDARMLGRGGKVSESVHIDEVRNVVVLYRVRNENQLSILF